VKPDTQEVLHLWIVTSIPDVIVYPGPLIRDNKLTVLLWQKRVKPKRKYRACLEILLIKFSSSDFPQFMVVGFVTLLFFWGKSLDNLKPIRVKNNA
jgi:hypothetical protein